MTDTLFDLPPGKPMRTLVNYHGGKWILAPWIIAHFPQHRVYVEPFGGGGSVLLRKDRSHAEIYNDLDGEIVNLFRVARDRGDELHRRIYLTPFSRDVLLESYQEHGNEVDRAMYTLVRSLQGFGSNSIMTKTVSFRANSNRRGSTHASSWKNFPRHLLAVIERLRGVVIENRDAKEVMAAQDSSQTLHYVDPPYVTDTRSGCKGYRYELTDSDHEQLANFLSSLKGHVIVSGYKSELYDRIFAGWKYTEREALADGAKPRTECLWIKEANQ